MADKVELTDTSGSHERVALDLMKHIQGIATDRKQLSIDEMLRLYQRCLGATFKPL